VFLKKLLIISFTLFVIISFASIPVYSQAATSMNTITMHGYLYKSNGDPAKGAHKIVVKVYDSRTGGIALFSEEHNATVKDDGSYFVVIGDGYQPGTTTPTNGIPTTAFSGDNWFIELKVDSDTAMSPRARITSAPNAINATFLGGFLSSAYARYDSAGTFTENLIFQGDANFTGTFQLNGQDISTLYAPSNHTHNASDITAGTLDDARLSTNVAKMNSSINPTSDNSYDLGSGSFEWRNMYIDGTAHIDSIELGGVTRTSWPTATGDNLGNHTCTQNLNLNSNYLYNGGGSYSGDVAFGDDAIPRSNASYDLGTSSYRWNRLHVNGIYLNGSYRTSWPSGGVTGSGSSGRLALWSGSSTLTSNSSITYTSSSIACGTSASSSYKVYGYYSSSSYGYLGSSSYAIYGRRSSGNTLYTNTGSSSYSNHYAYTVSSSSQNNIAPDMSGWGGVGHRSVRYHWRYIVGDYLYYDTGNYSFDTYDDLELLQNIKGSTVYDPLLKNHITYQDEDTQPLCVQNYEDIAKDEDAERFHDVGRWVGLLQGAVRQLDNETDERIDRLTERTEILAKVVDTEFNIKTKAKEKIFDFGSIDVEKKDIWINYSDEFKNKLQSIKPVLTITPISPDAEVRVIEKTSNGFRISSSKTGFELDWSAMAKVVTEYISNVEHIDDVLYKEKESIPEDKYPVLMPDPEKTKDSLGIVKIQDYEYEINVPASAKVLPKVMEIRTPGDADYIKMNYTLTEEQLEYYQSTVEWGLYRWSGNRWSLVKNFEWQHDKPLPKYCRSDLKLEENWSKAMQLPAPRFETTNWVAVKKTVEDNNFEATE